MFATGPAEGMILLLLNTLCHGPGGVPFFSIALRLMPSKNIIMFWSTDAPSTLTLQPPWGAARAIVVRQPSFSSSLDEGCWGFRLEPARTLRSVYVPNCLHFCMTCSTINLMCLHMYLYWTKVFSQYNKSDEQQSTRKDLRSMFCYPHSKLRFQAIMVTMGHDTKHVHVE